MEHIRRLHNILKRYGLSIELKRIRNRHPDDGEMQERATHYECRVKKADREMKIDLTANFLKQKLTPGDVLFVLAMDASACAMLEGFEEFHEELHGLIEKGEGIPSGMDTFKEEYDQRCSESRRLRDFIGEEAYEELREHVEGFPPD